MQPRKQGLGRCRGLRMSRRPGGHNPGEGQGLNEPTERKLQRRRQLLRQPGSPIDQAVDGWQRSSRHGADRADARLPKPLPNKREATSASRCYKTVTTRAAWASAPRNRDRRRQSRRPLTTTTTSRCNRKLTKIVPGYPSARGVSRHIGGMRLPREDRAREVGAERRYLAIKHTIPDGLDHAAQLLDEALDHLARYGLAEALQPDAAPYQATADGLRTAANRLRAAVSRMPDPGSSRQPPRNTARATQAAQEPAPSPLAADLTERVPTSASVDAQAAAVPTQPATGPSTDAMTRPALQGAAAHPDRAHLHSRQENGMTADPPTDDGFQRLQERAQSGDVEAEAAFIILNQRWAREKAQLFVDIDGIDFAGMLSAHTAKEAADGVCETWQAELVGCDCGPYWSSGEAQLLRLAWNLWSGDGRSAVDVARLLDICDDRAVTLAFAAIHARGGGRLPTIGTPLAGAGPARRFRTGTHEIPAPDAWPPQSPTTAGEPNDCYPNARRSR